MPVDYSRLIRSAEARLTRAREIADAFRQDRELHVLLMIGVFALEDVLFSLRELSGELDSKILKLNVQR